MNTEFDLTRLGHFMKRQLYMNISSMWIAVVAIVGVLLVISGLVAYFNPEAVENLVPLYLVVLFLGGFIFTSKIYNEMNSPQQSYAFLTLPVSTLEKLVGAWLLVAPVFLVTALASVFILTFASATVAGQPARLPGLANGDLLRMVGSFMVTQTFFFLGAVAFRGNNFLKTLLALFLIAMVLAAYTGGLGYLLFGGGNHHLEPGSELKGTAEFIFKEVVPFLYWFVLPLFLLVVSYFKLKERQV
ncbi:hypothetical protein CLV24_12855 [Pontibacter ummariensis]|uniref:ABC-2 family transporter protein n=1 Tax=Pontibacter ummariensis TaxID=1610492 RepID=A0A239K8Z7_9BACT|nr:hypothetical protein [Pontibacter ummariensis]PRY06073.1 hypothetical protein CLV24_12855 [Pontibacter ummariensis]SNT14936.1 hypothetical protein SAMN06296052_12755 [Pontibacter ummariensis]